MWRGVDQSPEEIQRFFCSSLVWQTIAERHFKWDEEHKFCGFVFDLEPVVNCLSSEYRYMCTMGDGTGDPCSWPRVERTPLCEKAAHNIRSWKTTEQLQVHISDGQPIWLQVSSECPLCWAALSRHKGSRENSWKRTESHLGWCESGVREGPLLFCCWGRGGPFCSVRECESCSRSGSSHAVAAAWAVVFSCSRTFSFLWTPLLPTCWHVA